MYFIDVIIFKLKSKKLFNDKNMQNITKKSERFVKKKNQNFSKG